MNRRTIFLQHQKAHERGEHCLRATISGLPGMIAGLMVLLILLSGCVPIVPSAKHLDAINAGEKALVLIRIQCTVDDQSLQPCVFSGRFSMHPGDVFIAFAMGGFDTFGEPVNVTVWGLSEESFKAGWTAFVLSPGIHYLYVRRPDSRERSRRESLDYYRKHFRDIPIWRIDVPEHAKLIYAGTLHVTGENRGTLLLGSKIIEPVGTQDVTPIGDKEDAVKLLSEYLPEAGEVKTILMRRWNPDTPLIFRSPLPD